jgi:hypothetical protein
MPVPQLRSGLLHVAADNGTLTLNMRMQALAIHSGREGALHYGTSLHNHLSFHHMFDRAELAEVPVLLSGRRALSICSSLRCSSWV